MQLTKPGWTMYDHLHKNRLPGFGEVGFAARMLGEAPPYLFGTLIILGMFVGFIWLVKQIWMAV